MKRILILALCLLLCACTPNDIPSTTEPVTDAPATEAVTTEAQTESVTTEAPVTEPPEPVIPPSNTLQFDNSKPGIYNYCPSVITEADGTPLLEIQERDFVFCSDIHYKYALMAELRKGEGFEDRNWL